MRDSSESRHRRRGLSLALSLGLTLVVLACFALVGERVQDINEVQARAQITREMSARASALDSAVNTRLALLTGLHEFVVVSLPEGPSRHEFDTFAAGLYAGEVGIRAIQVAPAGVVSLVYPIEGNVTGSNLLTDTRPEVAEDVKRTLESESMVISGPYELRQGGLGLVSRQTVRTADVEFWGFANIVLDVPPVLEEAGLAAPLDGTRFALRDNRGRVFAGEADVFDADPVTFPIKLADGAWELAAVPTAGWHAAADDGLALLWVAGVATALSLGALLFVALDYQRRLRDEVIEQTALVSEQRDLFARVTETSPVGITVISAAGQITFANGAAEDILGLRRDEISERTYDDPRWQIQAIDGGEFPDEDLPVARVLASGDRVIDTRHAIVWPDGERKLLSVNASPLVDSDGSLSGVVATFVDITEQYLALIELQSHRDNLERLVGERTEELGMANTELDATNAALQQTNAHLERSMQALAQANRELVEATRAKSQFLANMSHELRTPLNSIIGFSDLLVAGKVGQLDSEQLKQITMINSSGKHLLELINDVLDLAKIEAGQLRLEMSTVDVGDVVLTTVASLTPLATSRGLVLTSEVEDGTGEIVSDRTHLTQVLINLVGNAIKFTDEGSVSVAAMRRGDQVVLEVADTGRGILPVDLPHIYDEFYQAVGPNASKSEGTGLGLAVSRSYVEALGGTIEVESQPGIGSTFTVRLPANA